MAKPKSKPSDPARAAGELLRHQSVRAVELVAAIHAVNPTGLGLPASEEKRRYDLKSKLQSRLILEAFEDLEFEVTDEPGVVGLRYRPQDRDACHAVLAELDLEARSQVQLYLDTHEPGPARLVSPGGPARAPAAPRAGLLAEGAQTLADYDYEAARRCFETALPEAEDDAAAVALLELFVDHLAEWRHALELAPRLSPSQLTPAVRALLAIAAAQEGDVAACQRFARPGGSLRFAVAFCLLTTQALQRGDFPEAVRVLGEAKAIDPLAPEVVAAEAELARLKAAQREPGERELESLLASGDSVAAEEKARSILAQWPESGAARRVVREADARAQEARIATLQQQAMAASEAGDDAGAIALWGHALLLGAPSLEKLMAAASARIEAKRRQLELDAVVTQLRGNGDRLLFRAESVSEVLAGEKQPVPISQALTSYLALDAAARGQVRLELGAQVLEWLEQLGSGVEREWPANIAAVLALSEATGAPVSERLGLLASHEERVRRIEHGRLLLAEAEAHAQQEALKKERDRLEAARLALSAGRWREVVSLAHGHHPQELREEWRRIADEALARLESDSRVTSFEALFAGGDLLGALGVIQAAELDESSDQELWAGKRKTLSPKLRVQFQVQVGDGPGAVSTSDLAKLRLEDFLSHALDEAGALVYWAVGFGTQLFIRKIDLRAQRVVLMVALTTPVPFSFARAQVEGETLWVRLEDGAALLLSTRTWDVLRWHAPAHVTDGEILEDSAIVPGGRFHWLSVRPRSGGGELLRVVDLERGRVLREIEREGIVLTLVVTEHGPRVWLTGFDRGGRLFEAGGATEATLPVGVQQVSVAPTGRGLIAVRGPEDLDDSDDDVEALRVLHLRASGAAPELVEELTGSDSESTVLVATALEVKASFVLYVDVDRLNWLVAYTEEGGSLRRRWRVRCPTQCILLQDLQARHVALVAGRGDGLRCVLLGAEPPELEELFAGLDETAIPKLAGFKLWCSPWWDGALAGAADPLHRMVPSERQRSLARLLEERGDKPDQLALLASELRGRMPSEADQVLALLRERSPDHAGIRLAEAGLAVEKSDWQGVLAALDPAREAQVPSRARAHMEHLRGMALYHLGRLGEAKEAFSFAQEAEDSGCHVEGWPEWLEALMGERVEGRAGQLLSIVREAKAALAEKRGPAALKMLDVPLVWGAFDVQLGAQLAVAAHDNNVTESGGRMRARFIAAAFLEEVDEKHRATLPLGEHALSSERSAAAAGLVRGWLDAMLRAVSGFHRPSDLSNGAA